MVVPRPLTIALLLLVLPARWDLAASGGSGPDPQVLGLGAPLVPTVHPTLPSADRALWLVPEPGDPAGASSVLHTFAAGVKALDEGRAADALPKLSVSGLAATILADYGLYHRARALLTLDRHDEALGVIRDLRGRKPVGSLAEDAVWLEGETLERLQRFGEAQAAYAELAAGNNARPDEALSRLARTAERAGDRKAAVDAWRRLFYEHPLSDLQGAATSALVLARDAPFDPPDADRHAAALKRAQALYDARRFVDARQAYAALRGSLSGEARDLADLRIAVCDADVKRRRTVARDRLASLVERGSHEAEARYHHARVLREMGATTTFVAKVGELVERFPESRWAEEALNDLGTYYTRTDDDERAIETFRQLYARFPKGAWAERAAWKVGWADYRAGAWDQAIRTFESAAATFPRANTRPAWLYWAARAHEQRGHQTEATDRYRLVATDYLNSYYGRLASSRLPPGRSVAGGAPAGASGTASGDVHLPADAPAHALVRMLLSLELYADAMRELQHLQRINGRSPELLATMAWIHHRTGDLLKGTQTVKRAYPQYLAAGGENLPIELLQVVFPVAHLDLIREHAAAHGLDPYLVAALIAQESGYDAKAKSRASAYGLMQILPSTGRRLARQMGLGRFRTSMLTDPAVNIRMGTYYFAQLLNSLDGQVHLALASYNAGASRARTWAAERPGLERDVFIDDIPFPETQGYVKRILGMTEDYRRLYDSPTRASRE